MKRALLDVAYYNRYMAFLSEIPPDITRLMYHSYLNKSDIVDHVWNDVGGKVNSFLGQKNLAQIF